MSSSSVLFWLTHTTYKSYLKSHRERKAPKNRKDFMYRSNVREKFTLWYTCLRQNEQFLAVLNVCLFSFYALIFNVKVGATTRWMIFKLPLRRRSSLGSCCILINIIFHVAWIHHTAIVSSTRQTRWADPSDKFALSAFPHSENSLLQAASAAAEEESREM